MKADGVGGVGEFHFDFDKACVVKKSQGVGGLYPPGILRQHYCCRTHNSDYDPVLEHSNDQHY
jgi:hypothetical protein